MQDSNLVPRWLVISLGISLFVFLILVSLGQILDLKITPQPMRVSATASLTVIPDVATINIGIISEGTIQTDVQHDNTQKTNQVIAFIKQQKIDAKDIKTSAFYSTPVYQYKNGSNTMTGYQASQMITVEIKHIDSSTTLLETIVNGVISHGANQIQGVTFHFSNQGKLEQTLRKKAIELAKQKAQDIAQNTSLKLGRIINVITSDAFEAPLRPYALAMAKIGKTSPNIEPGSQTISETITLIFEVH